MARIRSIMVALTLAMPFDSNAGDHPNVRLREHLDRRGVERALEGARNRIATAGCAHVLTSFKAIDGRTLAEVLSATGQNPDAYLASVLFYSGRREGSCAKKHVLAYTAPGSRAVLVCSQFYLAARSDPAY